MWLADTTEKILSQVKMALGSTTAMKVFLSRTASWLPVIFVIAGSFAMAAGIFSTSALAVSPADVEIPLHAAVYVGAGTCYTCHTDDFDGWSAPLDLQAMADASAKPKRVVAEVAALEELAHVAVDDSAEACASWKDAKLASADSRQYVVNTDKGESLLPLQWDEQEPESAVPDDHTSEATDCTVNDRGSGDSFTPLVLQSDAPSFNRFRPPWAKADANRHTITTLQLPSGTAFIEGPSA